MFEIAHARFIKEASQRKHYVVFTNAVFHYVSSHSKLTANEKLIWFNIAQKVFWDQSLTCVLTYSQIAKMIGISADTVRRSVRTLKQFGFLQTDYNENNQLVTYSIDLPSEGLSLIDIAPNRVTSAEGEKLLGVPPAKCEAPPCKIPPTPPAKCTTLINIINNINKHNIHDLPEVENLPEPESVKNADALVNDFKQLEKKYASLPTLKRIETVNSHFRPEEREMIHTHILEEARKLTLEETKRSEPPAVLTQKEENKLPSDTQVIHLQGKLIDYEFDDEHYFIEEQVKNQILHHIPMLYKQGKLKGEVASKPIKTLLSEVLFYTTKAGSMQSQSMSQLRRFFVARKLCLQGSWERPRGMMKDDILGRERQWQAIKQAEMKAAAQFMGELSCN